RHQAQPAEERLPLARVVDDVVRLSRAVAEELDPRRPGAEGVRDAGAGRPGDDAAAADGQLVLAEQAVPFAGEDDEELLLRGVAVRGSVQLSGGNRVEVQARSDRARGGAERVRDAAGVALVPPGRLAFVDVDDRPRPRS